MGADAESDRPSGGTRISIHGPRVGADDKITDRFVASAAFQSTAPVWGPTKSDGFQTRREKISIHGPRVGADPPRDQRIRVEPISIHGPRVGADLDHRQLGLVGNDFNPRPPCGGRPAEASSVSSWLEFQSTAPVWGPTQTNAGAARRQDISIHGPRVGADH